MAKVAPSGLSRQSGTQINYRYCPACSDTRWKVYQDPESGKWICFVCMAAGIVDPDKTRNTLHDMLSPVEYADWPEIPLPEMVPLSDMARRYLRRRGITRPEEFGIAEMEDSTRVVFPYRGAYGRTIFYSSRYFLDDGRAKYLTAEGRHPLYVLPSWSRHPQVVIVEGVLDAIVHWLATGIPTIALGGKSLPGYLERDLNYLAPAGRTVMLDGEAMKESLALAMKIGAKVHLLPPGMDPADFYGGK